MAQSSVKKEDKLLPKWKGSTNSFNSTPSVIGRAVQQYPKKSHPLATQISP
jgi:hypothetical protein